MNIEQPRMLARVRENAPLKVLFFSHDAKLGDAVVNTAFVSGLLRQNPGCEIHATVAGATAGFWSKDHRVKRLWMLHKPGWGQLLRCAYQLRRERFDFIVTWQRMRSEKNRVLLWLANAREVIDLHEFNQGDVRHKIDSCAEALAQMNQRHEAPLTYDIPFKARCEQLDELLPDDAELIVINLFAADAERNVPLTEAVAMLRGLRDQAPQAVLCLVCMDQTEAAAHAVLAAADVPSRTVNCEGNLNRLLDLCDRADLVISPDTALIHIASAFETPVIGIYQNNGVKAVQWGPRSRLHGLVLSTSADSIAGFSVPLVLSIAADLRRQQHASA